MARMADSPRPWPRSLVMPITWTAPAEVTWIRTDTTPSTCSRVASAVYSGRGLKMTLGAVRAAVWARAGLDVGGGVFWPRLTGPATRPVEVRGPVPLLTPSLTPLTALAALSRPAMFWPRPEPRLTAVAAGPAPLLEAGIPAKPLLPRLMALVAGRLETAMGLVCWPRATGAGWGELFTTDAGVAWARLTTFGAGGGVTILGGAGWMMGTC